MAEPMGGKGTILQVAIASVYTAVGGVVSITPMRRGQEVYTWTPLASGSVRRRGSGQEDGGEPSIKINYDPENAAQQYIISKAASEAPEDFKLIDSQNNEYPFSAVITNFAPDEITAAAAVTATITLGVDGSITWPTP